MNMISRMTRISLAALLWLAASVACAQGQAFTNRATDLKDQGNDQAKTLASLKESTEVKVLQRGGGWTKVEAGGQQGWVKVFHLRFPATATTDSSGGGLLSGITSAIGGRPKSQQAGIQTVGVRGLSPDELKNASPDAESLKRMQGYTADKPAAERFAREGKLADVKIDYNEEARK